MATVDEKRSLRRQVRDYKAHMTPEMVLDASADIFAQVEEMPEFREASTVLAYWSMPDEVGTHDVISRWSASKKVVLPVVDGRNLILREYSPDTMLPGYREILEPGPDAAAVPSEKVDFAIIPGMAFDRDGRRLGRGGGFYDGLLPQLSCMKVGVCFGCQVVESVPCEEHDCKVDKVVTNRK